MNALIALSHFCEVHGPCVVFCTQAIHKTTTLDPLPTPSADNHVTDTTATISIPTNRTKEQTPDYSANSFSSYTSASEPLTPPQNATSSLRVSSPPSLRKSPTGGPLPASLSKSSYRTTTSTRSSSCAACSAQLPTILTEKDGSPQEAKMLLTRDEEDPYVKYVGTKSPQQLHLYKAVRLACVRSLTTEFCPGRDGPVLFGDDENGYVMSYMFKLRDSQARGETRVYSLMMLMTDRVYLVSCWPFLVSAFRSMAINLQERADAVFQQEKESRPPYTTPFANSRRVAPMSQEQFFRRRSHTALRSLVDLLGVKDIYAQIHAQFSYILKLSARKRMEKLTQGRSASPLYHKMRAEYHSRRNKQERQPEDHQSADPLLTTQCISTEIPRTISPCS